jgi:hypothetical protein
MGRERKKRLTMSTNVGKRGSMNVRLFLKQPSTGLKEPAPALLDLWRGLCLPSLQIGEVRLAIRAGDCLEVELDVILETRFEGLQ